MANLLCQKSVTEAFYLPVSSTLRGSFQFDFLRTAVHFKTSHSTLFSFFRTSDHQIPIPWLVWVFLAFLLHLSFFIFILLCTLCKPFFFFFFFCLRQCAAGMREQLSQINSNSQQKPAHCYHQPSCKVSWTSDLTLMLFFLCDIGNSPKTSISGTAPYLPSSSVFWYSCHTALRQLPVIDKNQLIVLTFDGVEAHACKWLVWLQVSL